jgi:hypothetical protein
VSVGLELPAALGTEIAVKLCDLLSPEAGHAFSVLANGHRPIPVKPYAGPVLTKYLHFHEECGAYGCGQDWPCDTRRLLDIVEALVSKGVEAGVMDARTRAFLSSALDDAFPLPPVYAEVLKSVQALSQRSLAQEFRRLIESADARVAVDTKTGVQTWTFTPKGGKAG